MNCAQAFRGATVPWTTYEAEIMATTGTVLGPDYGPNTIASESSGRKCVRLDADGQYVEFIATAAANALIVRYNVADSVDGVGMDSTISLYKNGSLVGKLPVTSRYSWLYGNYPFANTPASGSPRNFFDEVRTNGLSISSNDVVRLQKDSSDTASYYIIDLVDAENVAGPISQPGGSVSIKSAPYNAVGNGENDDTAALQNCINANSSVWIPSGKYKITGSINLPSDRTIQGAGMWHTTMVGDPALYTDSNRRITLHGNGSNIQLRDFAIVGQLNYRNDSEPNDGLGGAYGTGSAISRIWVEHTKTGGWIVNSQGLKVDGCRFRNTIADGIALVVGMRGSTVTNCTTRGTGDDCFAMWPATYIPQTYSPGLNVVTHCTAVLPFLANGGAIYGGASNRVEDCVFRDITYGCGILISTTFPVGENDFSGITVAQRSDLIRCGGYDPGFGWRAALQLCLENKSLSGINLNDLNITNSISDGMSIIAPGSIVPTGVGTLSNATMANVSIANFGIGIGGRHGLWARSDAIGSMIISNSAVAEFQNDSFDFVFRFLTSIQGITVNGDASVTLTYATIPGLSYQIETTTNLAPALWVTVAGSETNAVGDTVTFTDPTPGIGRRFYRVNSP